MMILYHFTSMTHLPSILEHGLNRGEVAISAEEVINAVWFTTDDAPAGHGLGSAREMTDDERAWQSRRCGRAVPPGTRRADKSAVRIKVVIPSSDRRLVPWLKWGRKHCRPDWLNALNRCAPRYRNHFIYFATVAPERFIQVENIAVMTAIGVAA